MAKYSPKAQEKVTGRKQAVAIGLSEALKEDAKIPKEEESDGSTKK